MKTIYEIYFVKPSQIDYFSKIGTFIEKIRKKEINHFLLSFCTKRIEELLKFNPSLEKELFNWGKLKKISFPLIYKTLDFSKMRFVSLIRFYEMAKRISSRIDGGIHIIFLDKIFDLNEISEEVFELGFNKFIFFDKDYLEFSKIKLKNGMIMIYNPIGKKNTNSPYKMIFKENIDNKDKEDDTLYINSSPEEFFYLTEKYFENSESFIYKEKMENLLFIKKVEDLLFNTEYLISYSGFLNSLNFSLLIDYVFEEFTSVFEGKLSLREFKIILNKVLRKIGFENIENGKLFNPYPFTIFFPDRKKYLLKELKPFEFAEEKEFLRILKNFKVRKIGNNFIFIHKKREDFLPLNLNIEIKKDEKTIKDSLKEVFFERGKHYKIYFENLKFTKGEIKLKKIFSQFYPYVIFEGSVKGKNCEILFKINLTGERVKILSHRFKILTTKKEGFAYLLYSQNLNFAVFSPFPYLFKINEKEVELKIKEGPFLIVLYPFPESEKSIWDKFLSFIYLPFKIKERDVCKMFAIKEGIFLLCSMRQVDYNKFILRGISIGDSFNIIFFTQPKEVKLLNLKGEKEVGSLEIFQNEVKINSKEGEMLTIFINF